MATIASSTTPASSVSTSHDYARCLQQAAEFLLSRPAFDIPTVAVYSFNYFLYHAKAPFIAAVKALGTGKKKMTETDIEFVVETPGARFSVEAPRHLLCRLVKPAQYECDPLLSPDEEQQLGGGQ